MFDRICSTAATRARRKTPAPTTAGWLLNATPGLSIRGMPYASKLRGHKLKRLSESKAKATSTAIQQLSVLIVA